LEEAVKSMKDRERQKKKPSGTAREKARGSSSPGATDGALSTALSGIALIEVLRGSCKGRGSMAKGLERERRREDRIKMEKLRARYG
jgi:hypothetical protein